MAYKRSDLVLIDLSTKQITRKPCPEPVIRNYLGGRGLGDYILLKHLNQNVGPLDPANIMVFAAGLLTGSRMITTGRLHVSSRSPLTGFIGTSNSGGMFGSELKGCGILALVITGRAEHPVFIKIKGEQITLEDATGVWGLELKEAKEKLQELAGEGNAKMALIGPAGEKLASLASIMVGPGHACGRTGLGAVMGSKNLKAIVLKKEAEAKNEHPGDEAVQAVKDYLAKLKKLPDWEEWTTLGSTDSVIWTHQLGAIGAKNYTQTSFDGIETATGASFKDMIVKHRGCYNCPIRCKATVKIDRGRHSGFEGDRGEYEPLSTWGPKCGNADGLESIYLCNMCDEYGLDSIGAGNAVAFAIDLYERGILTDNDTGGLALNWGNAGAMEALLEQIAYRSTRLGDALARGMKQAAQIIGRGAEEYTHTVKGLSMTIMDPRGFKGSGLGYAVSNRGADFGYVYAKPEYAYTKEQALAAYGTEKAADRLSEEGKPAMVRQCMLANAVVDSLGICKIAEFGMMTDFDLKEAAKLVSAFTGISVDSADLMQVGEKIINAERLFNFRFGANGADDTLPVKFLTQPIDQGPCKGSVVNLGPMLKEFYSLMDWDKDGTVSKFKIKELGLAELTGDIGLDKLWG